MKPDFSEGDIVLVTVPPEAISSLQYANGQVCIVVEPNSFTRKCQLVYKSPVTSTWYVYIKTSKEKYVSVPAGWLTKMYEI